MALHLQRSSTSLPTPTNIDARKRTRNACDACRARKIKCRFEDETTDACKSCTGLGIICRKEKPRKRRGPTSKYVETQRQRDLAETEAEAMLPSGTPRLEDIAPDFIIQQILRDWFELVHPVAPILHRDTLLHQLSDPACSADPTFIDLIASVCAATISSLRRRATAYGGVVTVDQCYQLHLQLERSNSLNLRGCIVKYNFGVALLSERGMDDSASQLLLVEATAGVLHILHYNPETLSFMTRELAKRLFWLCYAGQCTLGLHGRPYLLPRMSTKFIDICKPMVLSDADLAFSEEWHGSSRSYVLGLLELNRLFMIWNESQLEDCKDLEHIQRSMTRISCALDDLPPELRWRGGLSRPARSNFGTDVQMVNLYITQMQIRSFLLDQMDEIAVSERNSAVAMEVTASRQMLVDDMLAIVYQMPEDILEANGPSLISKLRDIGLALLDDSAPSEKSFTNLDRLLAKLEILDVRRGSQVETTSPVTSITGFSHPT